MNIGSKKSIGELTIDVSVKGYEKTKQQLRNIEATLDRIIEKQEKIGAISANTKDHDLLIRIDTDCGRIVRRLGCDEIQTVDESEFRNRTIEQRIAEHNSRAMK